jgi:hypothetical protein
MFQVESVRDAAFGCDWVGSSIPFQQCLMFIIATANKGFQLTAGKFVPVSNLTAKNVGRINILYYFTTGHPPLVALTSFVLRILYHTQDAKIDRYPLEERTARRRNLYLITYKFHYTGGIRNRHPSKRTAVTQVLDHSICKYSVLKIKQSTRMLCKISYKEILPK